MQNYFCQNDRNSNTIAHFRSINSIIGSDKQCATNSKYGNINNLIIKIFNKQLNHNNYKFKGRKKLKKSTQNNNNTHLSSVDPVKSTICKNRKLNQLEFLVSQEDRKWSALFNYLQRKKQIQQEIFYITKKKNLLQKMNTIDLKKIFINKNNHSIRQNYIRKENTRLNEKIEQIQLIRNRTFDILKKSKDESFRDDNKYLSYSNTKKKLQKLDMRTNTHIEKYSRKKNKENNKKNID